MISFENNRHLSHFRTYIYIYKYTKVLTMEEVDNILANQRTVATVDLKSIQNNTTLFQGPWRNICDYWFCDSGHEVAQTKR